MAARTCRLVINCNEEEVEKLILKINKYLEKIQTEEGTKIIHYQLRKTERKMKIQNLKNG